MKEILEKRSNLRVSQIEILYYFSSRDQLRPVLRVRKKCIHFQLKKIYIYIIVIFFPLSLFLERLQILVEARTTRTEILHSFSVKKDIYSHNSYIFPALSFFRKIKNYFQNMKSSGDQSNLLKSLVVISTTMDLPSWK